jgi:HK97 family phage portal protein
MRWPFTKPSNVAATTTLSNPADWMREVFGRSVSSGVTVTPLTAVGVPTVFACVNAVSRSLASIPLDLYRRTADGGKEIVTEGDRLYYLHELVHNAPNAEMTSSSFRRAVQANATLRNAGYAMIVRNGLGEVVELYPIPNADITPRRDVEGGQLYYLVRGQRVEASKILHIKGLTFDGLIGMDAVSIAREAIGLAIALQDHGAKYFPNASTPSMTIEFPQNMSPEQLKSFAAEFDKNHSGPSNTWKRMFLWNGAKLSNARGQTNNEQAQFIESKIYQDKAICQAFGVPQVKAGVLEKAHYNNVEQENKNYVTDTLMPWAVEWEQALNYKLLSPKDRRRYFFEFDFDDLTRADIAARYAALQIALQNGLKSRNEGRREENLNPVEGGDLFTISQNVQLLDKNGMPLPPPAAPEPASAEPDADDETPPAP